MGNIVTGIDSEFFWAIEASFLNGSAGMPITGTATHQPFNPAEGKILVPVPTYNQEIPFLQNSLDPNINFIHDVEYAPGKGLIPNGKGFIFHDPQLMLALGFTHKEKSGTWGGGAGTYGKLIGNFSDNDDEDTVMIQYKKLDKDGTVVEELTALGIKSEEFRIGFKAGGVLRTKYAIIVGDAITNTRAFSASSNFDDGKWADWAKSTYYPASSCKVYWDDSYAAEFSDLKIEECWFVIKTPQKYLATSDSLKVQYRHNDHREYYAEITALILGDTELDEYRAAFTSKTKKNLRLQWDTTANEEKFLDIDDAHIESMEVDEIPAANEAYRITVKLRGISADYEGNFNNLTDPTTDNRVTV